MAESAAKVLTDPALHQRLVHAGLQAVHSRFCAEEVVPRYEALYQELWSPSS